MKDGIHYTGMAMEVDERLKEHNRGKSKFTKGHIPWEIIYVEGPYTRLEARKQEKKLKRTSIKSKLEDR